VILIRLVNLTAAGKGEIILRISSKSQNEMIANLLKFFIFRICKT
jgi:hypothetical protein